MYFVHVFRFLLFSQLLQFLSAGQQGNCPSSFNCGLLGMIEFPFTTTERPDCGLLHIAGCDDHDPSSFKTVKLNEKFPFAVLQVGRSNLVIRDLARNGLLASRNCDAFSRNFTLPPNSPLASFVFPSNVTLFRCNRTLNMSPPSYDFQKYSCPDNIDIYYDPRPPIPPLSNSEETSSSLSECSMVQLPSKDLPDSIDPFTFVTSEITLEVELSDDCGRCYHQRRGRCQLDTDNKFLCAQYIIEPDKTSKIKLELGLTLGLGGLLAVMAAGLIVKVYLLKWKKRSPANRMIESFLKKLGTLQTRRYSYSELKKVTNSFRNKLGNGGYGSVYKGQLHDGRLVAVKMLAESKGNGEDFINDVASISRTYHVNIVKLLGFCIQYSKRALIYEFMSNGSLEKFLQEKTEMLDHQLDCKTLYDIAMGVARGLEYLHRGCNTGILHLDIKPHNILLDEMFCPKISDFGLAKICPKKESIISLTDARGTIGYIAPEVFSRNFGRVSHKSDVYSYGMMILEMVGGKKNINIDVECSSEIYFPHWIYKSLKLNQELELRCIKNESDKERVRKMTLVGLWCIQTDPANRPAMNKVVEMLDGSMESLQMPPKPYIPSPTTSPHHSSTHDISSSLK